MPRLYGAPGCWERNDGDEAVRYPRPEVNKGRLCHQRRYEPMLMRLMQVTVRSKENYTIVRNVDMKSRQPDNRGA